MKVFLSHIHEDKLIASKLKSWIEDSFLGQIDVFASSYPNDIKLGNKWLKDIEENIFDANLILVLANEISLTRSWIHFEAGAGWGKQLPVISLCYGQINKSNLPTPFSFFQSTEISEEDFSKNLFAAISNHCKFKNPPNIDYKKMDKELLELISDLEIDELGYVDHIIEMEDNFTKIGGIFIAFADEMQKLQIETELFTDEVNQASINPNAFDAKRLQTLSRKFSKTIKNFTFLLSNSNNEYLFLIIRTEENVKFILSYNRSGTIEEKEELEKTKPVFEMVLTQVVDTKTSIDGLSDIMNQLPKFERHLKKELQYCTEELDKLSENINQNTLLFKTSIIKIETILKEYD